MATFAALTAAIILFVPVLRTEMSLLRFKSHLLLCACALCVVWVLSGPTGLFTGVLSV